MAQRKTRFLAVSLLPEERQIPLVVEHLRYADAIRVDEKHTFIILECPKGVDKDTWTRQNTDRMRSFSEGRFIEAFDSQYAEVPQDIVDRLEAHTERINAAVQA